MSTTTNRRDIGSMRFVYDRQRDTLVTHIHVGWVQTMPTDGRALPVWAYWPLFRRIGYQFGRSWFGLRFHLPYFQPVSRMNFTWSGREG